MSVHAEEHNMSDDERPRPVRFSIFGQIQQRRLPFTNMPFKIEHSDDNEDYVDDNEEDQPLDFSSKKGELPTETTPMDLAKSVGRYDTWQPGSHSSESGVSDLCSNSPQSDREAHLPSVASPPLSVNPLVHQLQRQSTSPLNPMYNPLSALQPTSPVASLGMSKTMDPTITAATSQLLSNLAAVTNGGKGGKNTRPFKAYPKDPLNLPLGLYGLPLSGNGGNEGMSQQSNEAYSEFRRQMLAQVQAAKAKRTPKTSISNGSNHSSSRPNSVNDHHDNSPDHMIGETTIQGTVSVTDLRISTTEDEMHPKSPQSVDFSGTPSACSSLGNTNGTPTTTGSGKKRGRSGDEVKDEAYWERRRKNNEAAKRSRDARRAKEDEIAIRAAFLEQENLKLRFEVAALKAETTKLRCMVYSS